MRVLIAAGGTAGHINPALAIAGALKAAEPTAEIHFAGRREGMEYGLVTKAGYPFHHIEINGFQRRLNAENIVRNVIALWHLALSGPRTQKILNEVKPDLVIGCGGYVSGPVVRAAARRGIKTAIHEQNAFPGVTNKLLAPDVDIVFAAVPAAAEKLAPYFETRRRELEADAAKTARQLLLLESARNRLGKEDIMQYNVTIKTIPERYAACVHTTIPCYAQEGSVWKTLCEETDPNPLSHRVYIDIVKIIGAIAFAADLPILLLLLFHFIEHLLTGRD